MTKKEWKRVCVCMSEEEYEGLRLLASLRRESISKFIKYLLSIHLQCNQKLIPLIESLRESIAKPS
jgi:hypothetical protein